MGPLVHVAVYVLCDNILRAQQMVFANKGPYFQGQELVVFHSDVFINHKWQLLQFARSEKYILCDSFLFFSPREEQSNSFFFRQKSFFFQTLASFVSL